MRLIHLQIKLIHYCIVLPEILSFDQTSNFKLQTSNSNSNLKPQTSNLKLQTPMERTKWTERKFTFDFPAGWIKDVLERLRGTPIRIAEMISGISNEKLEFKPGDSWSIKEHIGHLADLEELHSGRIDELISRNVNLRPADMSNAKTNEAKHNQTSREDLLTDFVNKRKLLIEKFEKLDDETQLFSALHPRLQVPMRPIDVAYFAAEHDDHHLASIRELLK